MIPKTIAMIVLAERPFESDDGELFEPPLACKGEGNFGGYWRYWLVSSPSRESGQPLGLMLRSPSR